MYFRFDENGAFVCADTIKVYDDMIELTPPDNFSFEKAGEWSYADGEWTHIPEKSQAKEPTLVERIERLENQLSEYADAYEEGVNQA